MSARRVHVALSSTFTAIALVGLAAAADAPAAAPGSDDVKTLSCEGPFAVDSSETKLKAAFGDKNVVFKEVAGPEGTTMNATVLYPNDPKHKVTIIWGDEAKREKPNSIMIQADYEDTPDGSDVFAKPILWQTKDGLRIGSDVEAVEKANGKPFVIAGFGWDYGGYANDWKGGKLDAPKDPAACAVSIRFNPTAATADRIVGDGVNVPSDDKDVRAAKPRVSEISIGYAMPDAE